LKSWRNERSVAVLRSVSTITRSMKSPPGRCSSERSIVSQRWLRRSSASAPSRSVIEAAVGSIAVAKTFSLE
jgi:hypothetical protein